MQIMIILNSTHKSVGGKRVPSPYIDFLSFMSFMTLDVVQVCAFESKQVNKSTSQPKEKKRYRHRHFRLRIDQP